MIQFLLGAAVVALAWGLREVLVVVARVRAQQDLIRRAQSWAQALDEIGEDTPQIGASLHAYRGPSGPPVKITPENRIIPHPTVENFPGEPKPL